MSFAERVRSKLPSPRMAAFLGTVTAILGTRAYDRSECLKIQEQLKEQARVKAEEPMAAGAKPRRVEVYLVPPPGDGLYKSVEYFERWVKPIWDAAAMDYDLIKCRNIGEAHHKAREAVKRNRRLELAQPILNATLDNKPGTPVATPQPQLIGEDGQPKLPHGFTPEELLDMTLGRAPAAAMVAIGPIAFVEMVNGSTEGCAVLDTRPQKYVPPSKEEELSERAKAAGLSEDELKLVEEEETIAQTQQPTTETAATVAVAAAETEAVSFELGTPDTASLPTVDWVPHRNRIGWASLPGRSYRWFVQRRLAREIGEHALRIALELERPITEVDFVAVKEAVQDALDATSGTAEDAGLAVPSDVLHSLRTFTRNV